MSGRESARARPATSRRAGRFISGAAKPSGFGVNQSESAPGEEAARQQEQPCEPIAPPGDGRRLTRRFVFAHVPVERRDDISEFVARVRSLAARHRQPMGENVAELHEQIGVRSARRLHEGSERSIGREVELIGHIVAFVLARLIFGLRRPMAIDRGEEIV
jgi:hypothetical protein